MSKGRRKHEECCSCQEDDLFGYKSPELAELREKVSRIRRSDLPAQTSNAIDIDELIVDADNEVEVVQV